MERYTVTISGCPFIVSRITAVPVWIARPGATMMVGGFWRMAQDNGANLIWFIAGAAAGAAVALLFAPASGEETRKKIAEAAEQGRAALAESSDKIVERGREILSESSQNILER